MKKYIFILFILIIACNDGAAGQRFYYPGDWTGGDMRDTPHPSLWNQIGYPYREVLTVHCWYQERYNNDFDLQLLQNYPEVRDLSLQEINNFNHDGIVASFDRLKSLQYLERLSIFSECWLWPQLRQEQFEVIASLSSLKVLQLSANLSEVSFASLEDHPNLEALIIVVSGINLEQLESINKIPQLQILWLGEALPIHHLNALSSVKGLKISFDMGQDLIEQMNYDVTLPALESLDLSFLQTKGLRVDLIAPNLRILDLDETNTTGSTITHVGKMPYLEEIHLRETGITSGAIRNLAKATTLRRIDLASTNLKGADFSLLQSLPDLEFLGLANTSLTRADLQTLQTLTQLKKLDLTKLRCATMRNVDQEELRAALPNCTIIGID